MCCFLLDNKQAISLSLAESEARQAFFLAAMSHELRSPLTTVLGCVDMLSCVHGLSADAMQ
jgi:signal transduction histidine kinase